MKFTLSLPAQQYIVTVLICKRAGLSLCVHMHQIRSPPSIHVLMRGTCTMPIHESQFTRIVNQDASCVFSLLLVLSFFRPFFPLSHSYFSLYYLTHSFSSPFRPSLLLFHLYSPSFSSFSSPSQSSRCRSVIFLPI